MVDKKDKRAAKGALKLKKKKLKESGIFDQLTEVCRTSDSKDNLKIMQEDKPIKTDKEKKRRKSDSKKTIEKEIDVDVKNVQLPCKDLPKLNGKNSGRIVGHGHAKKSIHSKMFDISDSAELADANIGTKMKSKKSKKDGKRKRKDLHTANGSKMEDSQGEVDAEKVDQILSACSRRLKKKCKKDGNRKRKDIYIAKERETEESQSEVDAEKVDQISSVDEDCSRGMKKWLIQYKESRPGLKILQQRIDDFMTAYEAQQEQERKEREASAAEGGWTVVVHHKGRKKTTDSESGIAVGSVAQAAVMDKMSKKKSKEVGLDFYRFQRREAKRNEVMMLRSKFEQDKKRIQQLRAARKFRPY